jgi:hypothetical protein
MANNKTAVRPPEEKKVIKKIYPVEIISNWSRIFAIPWW